MADVWAVELGDVEDVRPTLRWNSHRFCSSLNLVYQALPALLAGHSFLS